MLESCRKYCVIRLSTLAIGFLVLFIFVSKSVEGQLTFSTGWGKRNLQDQMEKLDDLVDRYQSPVEIDRIFRLARRLREVKNFHQIYNL